MYIYISCQWSVHSVCVYIYMCIVSPGSSGSIDPWIHVPTRNINSRGGNPWAKPKPNGKQTTNITWMMLNWG